MALLAVCEAELLATALNVWLPLVSLVVSNAIVKGALLIAAPEFAPSTWNCTRVVFDDALAVTETLPETVAPDSGAVMLTVGGVGGGGSVFVPEPLRPLQPVETRTSSASLRSLRVERQSIAAAGFNRNLSSLSVTPAGNFACP